MYVCLDYFIRFDKESDEGQSFLDILYQCVKEIVGRTGITKLGHSKNLHSYCAPEFCYVVNQIAEQT
ncbi:hypothetical protein C3B79_2832 [Aeromonas hydrophila]|nr:hypothetical protein C3B79_2832 [Aeromonas hydrophila]